MDPHCKLSTEMRQNGLCSWNFPYRLLSVFNTFSTDSVIGNYHLYKFNISFQ